MLVRRSLVYVEADLEMRKADPVGEQPLHDRVLLRQGEYARSGFYHSSRDMANARSLTATALGIFRVLSRVKTESETAE